MYPPINFFFAGLREIGLKKGLHPPPSQAGEMAHMSWPGVELPSLSFSPFPITFF